jgi:hypothetical protein
MRLVVTPRQALDGARKGQRLVAQGIELVPRATALLDQGLALLADARATLVAIEDTERQARQLVQRCEATVHTADQVVEKVADLVQRCAALTDSLIPALQMARPAIYRIAESASPDDVSAAVKMINDIPRIVGKVDRDVVPVLDTLGTVAPDVRDLLDLTRELNEMLAALPGMGRVKRRLEQEEPSAETYRASEEPPPAPRRKPVDSGARSG